MEKCLKKNKNNLPLSICFHRYHFGHFYVVRPLEVKRRVCFFRSWAKHRGRHKNTYCFVRSNATLYTFWWVHYWWYLKYRHLRFSFDLIFIMRQTTSKIQWSIHIFLIDRSQYSRRNSYHRATTTQTYFNRIFVERTKNSGVTGIVHFLTFPNPRRRYAMNDYSNVV